MLTNIRKPTLTDVNYLLDIDLKCFEDPWDVNLWRGLCTDTNINKLVGTYYGTPMSFVFWQLLTDSDAVTIYRLAVKPKHRNEGTGTQLLKAVELAALQAHYKTLRIMVPESLCCPGQPQDASRWLNNRGFRAQPPIMRDLVTYCGRAEDAFAFNAPVGGIR
jgi:GNAT superfamily N-acetyltransferase